MLTVEATKRKIRKLLLLAADTRGHRAVAREALRVANRLLKANGWTREDVRGEDGRLPGDETARAILQDPKNFDRYVTVSQLILTLNRKDGLVIDCRAGKAALVVIVDFTGTSETVEKSTRLFHFLNRLVEGEWYATCQSQGYNRCMTGFLGGDEVKVKTDEPSWLQGLLEGFTLQHQRDEAFQKLQRIQQERKLELAAPPKLKRRRRFKKNPLAVMCLPKPKPDHVPDASEMVLEPEIVQEDIEQHREPESKPETNGHAQKQPLDAYCFRLGVRFGQQLYSRVLTQTKI